MIGLSIRYLKYNKKQTFTLIIGIILACVLLFSVGILFSSFRGYLIEKVDDYHVKISGNLNNISNDMLSSFKIYDGEYFVKFKDVRKTYYNIEKICEVNDCDNVVYNTKLLSLYGIGKNNYLDLFKELIFLIVFILGFSVFFIIYNSFGLMLSKKKRDIFLFKVVVVSFFYLCKLFFLEGLICGIIGIIFGFIFSLILVYGTLNLINTLFCEVLVSEVNLSLYFPFILIPLIFILLIIFLASLFPIFRIRKYKVMELFRENIKNNGKLNLRCFTLSYAYNNYVRNIKKYRSLIICVFILIILFNSFMRLNSYVLKILDDYVRIPNYDVKLEVSKRDYSKLEKMAKFLNSDEKNIYRSCTQNIVIPKESYNDGAKEVNYVLVTDLGGNEVINVVSDVLEKNGKVEKVNYNIFNKLDEVTINNKIGVKLTNDIPFGFENELIEGRIILNLNNDDFSKVCFNYSGNALIKSLESGLDDKITSYASKNGFDNFSYVNVKKAYELIDSFILLIKLFSYSCVCLVFLIAFFTILNIISFSIKLRKKELATLKSLGFDGFKINLSLLLESFIISGKGSLYAFPFTLLISNSLYKNLGDYFSINLGIFDYRLFLLSFFVCFLMIFICMVISHISLYKKTIIQNVKSELI